MSPYVIAAIGATWLLGSIIIGRVVVRRAEKRAEERAIEAVSNAVAHAVTGILDRPSQNSVGPTEPSHISH